SRLLEESAHDRGETREVAARVPPVLHDVRLACLQLHRGEPRVGAADVAGENDHDPTSVAVSRAAAAPSRDHVPRRARPAGSSLAPAEPSIARATTAALSPPAAATARRRAASMTGGVMVSRSTGAFVPITGSTSRRRSSAAGEPGKSDAVW